MSTFRTIGGYTTLVGTPMLALFLIVNSGGRSGLALPAQSTPGAPAMSGSFLLLLQVLLILAATQMAGAIFRRIGQPAVIGEIVAGVALGPSLAGWLAPSLSAAVFPRDSLGHLEALSQLGVVMFLFLVGASLDTGALREHLHAAVLTSHVSIVMPLALGAALAAFLYPDFAEPGISFTPFALFLGAAMSITAFPVLARILSERRLLHSRIGVLAIACAAVDDVTGWCVLAYITALVRSSHVAAPVWITAAGSLAFACFMIVVARPLLRRWESWFDGRAEDGRLLVPMMFVLIASALTTERLGLHLLFGGFLAGAILPRTPSIAAYVKERIEPFCLTLLMPLFFAFTGLRTNLRLLQSGNSWMVFGAIAAVAIIGKLGGATIAVRLAGFGWRDAATVGALLNTRGLMELVILNIGLELGILTPRLFTLMVLMAILTTLMTSPLLYWLRPPALARLRTRYEEEGEGTVGRLSG